MEIEDRRNNVDCPPDGCLAFQLLRKDVVDIKKTTGDLGIKVGMIHDDVLIIKTLRGLSKKEKGSIYASLSVSIVAIATVIVKLWA